MKIFLTILSILILSINCSAQRDIRGRKTVISVNLDSQITITRISFDNRVDHSINLLQTKQLSEISDSHHVNIMMCLNTVMMALDSSLQNRFTGGKYDVLDSVAKKANYFNDIINVYPEWIPNRGMGFYFPKLKMELHGTPRMYAYYNVVGK